MLRRRVFYQGSTDHRGTPEAPGRVVTLEHAHGSRCWGAAYLIAGTYDEQQKTLAVSPRVQAFLSKEVRIKPCPKGISFRQVEFPSGYHTVSFTEHYPEHRYMSHQEKQTHIGVELCT